MTIDDRICYSGFTQGYLTNPDNEKVFFVTLTSTGIKPEGASFLKHFSTPQKAINCFYKELTKYLLKNKGSVYVRKDISVFLLVKGWVASARLLASEEILLAQKKDI